MFITMMYPPKGFIFITIDLLFVGLNFIYLFIIYNWMISKHYILLFQQNFIWFYTKDKISVFSNSNPTKYSVDGQKLLHTLKTHPLERILGLSAKDIKNHFIPFDTDSIFLAMNTCASVTMTFAKDDFISPLEPPSIHHIQGAGGLVEVKEVGTIKYVIQDDEGINTSL